MKSTNKKTLILLLGCATIFFEAFDVSVVNLSLVTISRSLEITITEAQWLQTVYLVSFGGFLLLGGRLCDNLGAKRVYLFGMFVFGACSLAAAISVNMPVILLARGGQGFGAAMAMPAAITVLTTTFDEAAERNRAMGIFGSFAAFGFGLGLACGGMITRYCNWHWIFGINVPVFVLILVAAYRWLPRSFVPEKQRMNILSSAWLCLSLLLACFSIHELPRLGWYGAAGICTAGLSVYAMLHFDLRSPNPFFKKSLVTRENSKALAASLLLGACFLSYVFLATNVLMRNFHLDSGDAGFILFPFSMVSALVSSYFLPKLFAKIGVRGTAILAMITVCIAAGLLAWAVHVNCLPLVLFSLLCMNSFAIAIGYPSLAILALNGVSPENRGSTAGLQSCLYTIGSSIGLSITCLCLQLSS
jgi:MFS family permease